MADQVYCVHGFPGKLLTGVRPESYAATDGCYVYMKDITKKVTTAASSSRKPSKVSKNAKESL